MLNVVSSDSIHHLCLFQHNASADSLHNSTSQSFSGCFGKSHILTGASPLRHNPTLDFWSNVLELLTPGTFNNSDFFWWGANKPVFTISQRTDNCPHARASTSIMVPLWNNGQPASDTHRIRILGHSTVLCFCVCKCYFQLFIFLWVFK